jgi:hypothetical protein
MPPRRVGGQPLHYYPPESLLTNCGVAAIRSARRSRQAALGRRIQGLRRALERHATTVGRDHRAVGIAVALSARGRLTHAPGRAGDQIPHEDVAMLAGVPGHETRGLALEDHESTVGTDRRPPRVPVRRGVVVVDAGERDRLRSSVEHEDVAHPLVITGAEVRTAAKGLGQIPAPAHDEAGYRWREEMHVVLAGKTRCGFVSARRETPGAHGNR